MPYQFITRAKLPTEHGNFDIHVFENSAGQEHVMLTVGLPVDVSSAGNEHTDYEHADHDTYPSQATLSSEMPPQPATPLPPNKVPLIRIHSECLTGDAFRSLKCDCGPQLNAAMQAIQQAGCGAILYLRQEGRGIGLTNKIRAYALQDQGHDTLDANLMLGFPADAREYDMCAPMLAHIGVDKVRLLTNNPNKVNYLSTHGIEVVERVPLLVGLNAHNSDYMATKRDRMGHLFNEEP